MFQIFKPILAAGFTLASIAATAQVKLSELAPSATQAGIKDVHSGHQVAEPVGKSKNLLILMVPGTGGTAIHFRSLDSSYAAMGYHVLALDYVNQVVTTVCSKSEDSTCFDHFREEIFYGRPVSDKVEVDSVNSLLNRITAALNYLAAHDAKGGWKNFVKNGKPRWERIIASGHSQGAGHAGFIGLHYPVKGVMMLSGPQDYLQNFQMPAPWQRQKSVTPADKYYAFLHLQDSYVYDYQLKDVQALRKTNIPDTLMVEPGVPVKSNRHVMVTNIPTNNAHGSTLGEQFNNVRAYILDAISKK
ncbi:hypothetical protein SAMN05660909_01139 [Chitinophaga terrae (ex Kim and Jung 2007)]|uniref:Alpha/beta hydrolase n=1 Tax=Chitinophaga terrae (ex Kim and Jung 2007) TaxID=408074 RepID=A0A1H3ZBT8_9BACT|nr:hypothetical protein [Chitinophaga terrae (ex Kim and Jung 2007)]MDQ0109233.1 dienelactone hydrolase [Chitinophaga terrae (ex Kim and Jung 2007)]GEP88669.1 hypothetical protein CTE07_03140 [Chitinophaga terrae (ex Kim and Jung 2007)]SEA21110.1 hypothetical protein SAMN05660909_01139 [Chitinophaga terrae (ex Kim and Jung 2007)]